MGNVCTCENDEMQGKLSSTLPIQRECAAKVPTLPCTLPCALIEVEHADARNSEDNLPPVVANVLASRCVHLNRFAEALAQVWQLELRHVTAGATEPYNHNKQLHPTSGPVVFNTRRSVESRKRLAWGYARAAARARRIQVASRAQRMQIASRKRLAWAAARRRMELIDKEGADKKNAEALAKEGAARKNAEVQVFKKEPGHARNETQAITKEVEELRTTRRQLAWAQAKVLGSSACTAWFTQTAFQLAPSLGNWPVFQTGIGWLKLAFERAMLSFSTHDKH